MNITTQWASGPSRDTGPGAGLGAPTCEELTAFMMMCRNCACAFMIKRSSHRPTGEIAHLNSRTMHEEA
jgi:hypothetical protein